MEALYKLRNRPGAEEFRAAWDAAVDRGVMRLEDCALARAIEGEERMVVSGGKVIGTERRHNEELVMFFLRNRRGERYAPDWRSSRPGIRCTRRSGRTCSRNCTRPSPISRTGGPKSCARSPRCSGRERAMLTPPATSPPPASGRG